MKDMCTQEDLQMVKNVIWLVRAPIQRIEMLCPVSTGVNEMARNGIFRECIANGCGVVENNVKSVYGIC